MGFQYPKMPKQRNPAIRKMHSDAIPAIIFHCVQIVSLKCHVCGEEFSSEYSRDDHEDTAHGAKARPVNLCSIDKTFIADFRVCSLLQAVSTSYRSRSAPETLRTSKGTPPNFTACFFSQYKFRVLCKACGRQLVDEIALKAHAVVHARKVRSFKYT